jgi:hypothetical protein
VPVSTFAYGEEMMNEASITPDQKSKIRLQIAEMKKEIGKLSDRSAASKHRHVSMKSSSFLKQALFSLLSSSLALPCSS